MTLTGYSEGSNERFAAEVITEGMKHPLVWCFLLVAAQCSDFFFSYLHGSTTACVLRGGGGFVSNVSVTIKIEEALNVVISP